MCKAGRICTRFAASFYRDDLKFYNTLQMSNEDTIQNVIPFQARLFAFCK